MNIVKLNGRHKLFKQGYKVAFRFDNYVDNHDTIRKIQTWLEDQYGSEYNWILRTRNFYWQSYWAAARSRSSSRVYWIGLKNEEDAMMITLSI